MTQEQRRTGNVLLVGEGEPFAQKFSQVAQIFTKQSTYEVKTFLHMNLSYELIKHVKRNSCLCHFDGQRCIWCAYIIVDFIVGIFPLLIIAMLLTLYCPMVLRSYVFNLGNPLNDHSAEHDIILESYPKINSRLEIPHTNYVVQCNTVPNNNGTIPNTYMYIRL